MINGTCREGSTLVAQSFARPRDHDSLDYSFEYIHDDSIVQGSD